MILGAVWLAACSGNSVRSNWTTGPANPPFTRIFIVGVSTDYTQRCAFEFSLASQFTGSTVALPSCNTMVQTDALTRANIERFAKAAQADAVLTSTVVTLQMGVQKGNTRDTRATPYYQVTGVGYVTGGLGDYGVPVAFVKLDTSKSIPQITGDTHILTKLFDVKDAILRYTLDTTAKSDDIQSSSSATDTLTGMIGGKLHKDGVIQ